MRLERAVEILEKLRDGEDPRTGEELPPGNPAHESDVVRALYTVLETLPRGRAFGGNGARSGRETGNEPGMESGIGPARPRAPAPSRAGKPWTDEEDGCLGAAFDQGRTVGELARVLERSEAAIRLRLVKLGRLSPDDVPAGRLRRAVTQAVPEPAAEAAP